MVSTGNSDCDGFTAVAVHLVAALRLDLADIVGDGEGAASACDRLLARVVV